MAGPAFRVKFLRGSEASNNNYTGPAGEITIDTTNWRVRLHDGLTAGGHVVPNMTDVGSGGGGAVDSVNGQTGVVVLGATDVGLGSVDNYPTATQVEAEAADSAAHFMTPLAMRQFMESMGFTQDVGTGEWVMDHGTIQAA